MNYGTVVIGNQTWMAENLNCDVSGSKCYNNDPANCAKYGRLYDWATAMALPSYCNNSTCTSQIKAKHRGICPSGWHLPSNYEWGELISYVENAKVCNYCAGMYLKATSWNSNEGMYGKGEDTYGFTALPGGYGEGSKFYNVGSSGGWWSATAENATTAYYRNMPYDGSVNSGCNYKNGFFFSIRCVQD